MTSQPGAGRRSDRVRLGIAGLGTVAQAVHLPLVERLRDAFVIDALADLSPGLTTILGERYRVAPERRFGSLEELVEAPGLDGVAILTSGSHGAGVLTGLGAGLAVFVEKPLAFTLAEIDAIPAATPDGSPRPPRVQLGLMKLYDPAVRRALALAADRGYGPPRAIEVTVLHPSGDSQLAHARLLRPPGDVPAGALEAIAGETDRLRRIALGDAAAERFGRLYTDILLGSVVHEVALVRVFAGDPVDIDGLWVWPDGAWPPSLELTGRLPADGRVSIRWHYLPDYPAYREEVRIVYHDATIELAFPSPYLLHRPTVLRVATNDGDARRDEVWTSIEEAFETQILAFRDLILDDRRPFAGLAEGRADIVTFQRAIAAIARSQGVELGGEAAA